MLLTPTALSPPIHVQCCKGCSQSPGFQQLEVWLTFLAPPHVLAIEKQLSQAWTDHRLSDRVDFHDSFLALEKHKTDPSNFLDHCGQELSAMSQLGPKRVQDKICQSCVTSTAGAWEALTVSRTAAGPYLCLETQIWRTSDWQSWFTFDDHREEKSAPYASGERVGLC